MPKTIKPLSKARVSRGGSTRKPPQPTTSFIRQTDAKDNFLAHCRHVSESGDMVCVRDQAGDLYLTLTSRPPKDGFVTVSAQFFKNHFSRASALVRFGVVFRLTLRRSDEVVYARRHTSYVDPMDVVIEQWQETIVEATMADANENAVAQLAREFAAFARRQDARSEEDRETFRNHYKALVRGITRMSIGHLPFDDGMMPSARDAVSPRSAH